MAICYMTFMTDFLAGYGVPMIIPQGKEWGISSVDASRSLSGNTFMQGFGSLVAVPFAQRYGTYVNCISEINENNADSNS